MSISVHQHLRHVVICIQLASQTAAAIAAAAAAAYYIIDANVIKVGQRASPPASTKSMTFWCSGRVRWRRVLRRTKPSVGRSGPDGRVT